MRGPVALTSLIPSLEAYCLPGPSLAGHWLVGARPTGRGWVRSGVPPLDPILVDVMTLSTLICRIPSKVTQTEEIKGAGKDEIEPKIRSCIFLPASERKT